MDRRTKNVNILKVSTKNLKTCKNCLKGAD